MSTLPRYMKGDNGRFDFRVPNGLGQWKYPDGNDPNLKVEFYDSTSTLRATATVSGDPALSQGNDYHRNNNPDGGDFVAVDNIDLGDFALGVVEAWVYAEVSGMQVIPYPTVIIAFEINEETAYDQKN